MKRLALFAGAPAPLEVSQFALGCDHYGGRRPEDLAMRIMDAYFELGGNFLDTAHVYAQERSGEISLSERTVGRWIAANGARDAVVLSTKGAHPEKPDMAASRIDAKNIRADVFSSLETLGVEYLDIWFFHRDDPRIPAAEIIDMASELTEKGYVRHLGASNWTGERISRANEHARKTGKRGFDISQIQWSLARSTPESWEDPTVVCMNDAEYAWYTTSQTPVMAFSSQARGVVAKMIAGGEGAVPENWARRFMLRENLGRIERCRLLAGRTGKNPAGICLSYLTSAPFPVMPLLGCSSPDQVRDSLRFADAEMTGEEREYLTVESP